VCGGYWLGALKVSVCRHQHVIERHRVIEHYLLKGTGCVIELRTRVHRPETGRSCDLVIPATAGVELRCYLSYFIVEHSVDQRVYIFVRWKRLCTSRELLANCSKATLDFLAFLERQNSGPPKGHCPGLR
jgi:hypothetical protein